MCKVLMIAGIKKKHQVKVKEIAAKMADFFSRMDDDGFGYAAITDKGKIYGEKWLKKEDVFKLNKQPVPDVTYQNALAFFGPAAGKTEDAQNVSEQVYDSFGTKADDEMVSIIFHARKKTQGEKNIQNTHPFVSINDKHDPDTAIIHNGSIVNHQSLTKKYSTCDSEVILHEYLDQCMYYNPYMINKMAQNLVGEYTVGALSSIEYEDGTVTPILDIFKSNKDLYGCYVKEIETYLFATTDWSIKSVLKEMNLTFVALTEIKDGFLIRLNAVTGERMDDLIPFETSRKSVAVEHTPTRHSYPTNVRVINDHKNDTVEEAKEKFTRKHSNIFSMPYYDLPDGLNEAERAYFDELERDKNTDLKALRLAKKVMGL